MTEIAPAILTNDINDFRKTYAGIFALSHYFIKLHVDFCDGEFVPSKTVMPMDLGFLKASPLFLVAHLMTLNPQIYFADAKNAGFKWVIFHFEAFNSDDEIKNAIRTADSMELRPGIAINPETPLHLIAKFLPLVGIVQIMGIHPGFQTRSFIPSTVDKIRELRALSKNVIIIVDGGIRVGIARQCANVGADILVAGSAILRSEDEEMAIETLKLDIES